MGVGSLSEVPGSIFSSASQSTPDQSLSPVARRRHDFCYLHVVSKVVQRYIKKPVIRAQHIEHRKRVLELERFERQVGMLREVSCTRPRLPVSRHCLFSA